MADPMVRDRGRSRVLSRSPRGIGGAGRGGRRNGCGLGQRAAVSANPGRPRGEEVLPPGVSPSRGAGDRLRFTNYPCHARIDRSQYPDCRTLIPLRIGPGKREPALSSGTILATPQGQRPHRAPARLGCCPPWLPADPPIRPAFAPPPQNRVPKNGPLKNRAPKSGPPQNRGRPTRVACNVSTSAIDGARLPPGPTGVPMP